MTPRYTRLEAAQRRDQILDAANALFAERGYDEVSIEDIASAAGVTRGLVHHYFGGRKEVYLALVDRLGNVREERLRPPSGRSSRARVADSVSRWLDWTEANRTIGSPRWRPGRMSGDPDLARVVGDLVASRASSCSRGSTPTSPRTHRGFDTRWSAGPA